MPINTAYHSHAVMFGLTTEKGDQVLVGPAIKSFIPEVGHNRIYAGAKIHTHIKIGDFTPFLSYEMMWGEYYIYGAQKNHDVGIKHTNQGKGVLGLGYAISENFVIFAGASAQDYDPMHYKTTGKSPYRSKSLLLKIDALISRLF